MTIFLDRLEIEIQKLLFWNKILKNLIHLGLKKHPEIQGLLLLCLEASIALSLPLN